MPQIHLRAEPGDYAPTVLLPGDSRQVFRCPGDRAGIFEDTGCSYFWNFTVNRLWTFRSME